MTLKVNPIETTNLNYEICTDEFIELNGISYDSQGNYSQTLSTQFGCDSILNIELLVHQPQTIEESYAFCLRHGIIVQGVLYDTTGQFQQTIIDEFGCEGTLILNLEAEEDCDYCGTTLEINRFQITVKKHETGMINLIIKFKDKLMFKKIVSQNEFESLVAEYAIKKELLNYNQGFLYNSYNNKKSSNSWNSNKEFTEKHVNQYIDNLHLHNKSFEYPEFTFHLQLYSTWSR